MYAPCCSSPALLHISILFGEVEQKILGQSSILFARFWVPVNRLLLGLECAHVLWGPMPQGLGVVGYGVHIAQDVFFLSSSQSSEGVASRHGRTTHKLASFHSA